MKRQYVQRPQLVNKFMRREGTPVKGKGGKGNPWLISLMYGGNLPGRETLDQGGWAIISGNVGLSINIHVLC